MEKISIIIADDHKLIRDTWSYILNNDERFEVLAECSNGEEAVEMAKQFRPRILLMDINMSPINGIEATQLVRKFAPATRVIG
ncbi:MAG: response regulator, partial [Chitinophagaceae bacterium]